MNRCNLFGVLGHFCGPSCQPNRSPWDDVFSAMREDEDMKAGGSVAQKEWREQQEEQEQSGVRKEKRRELE